MSVAAGEFCYGREMRVVALSDIHGFLPHIPECDLLVISGDLCPLESHDIAFQARWLDTTFRAWLQTVPARHIVAVAGNHDFVFEQMPEMVPDLDWHYLKDQAITIDGLLLFGSPWQPWFHDWAFNAPAQGGELFLAKKFVLAPEGCQLFICHGPPKGHGDVNDRGLTCGSQALTERLEQLQPALMVCGHIHEGYGISEIGRTMVVNASYVDRHYHPRSGVTVLDLEQTDDGWRSVLAQYSP
jgi:Icc-related predicted phosphoesterase